MDWVELAADLASLYAEADPDRISHPHPVSGRSSAP
jgi:hypothetical protein